MARTLGFTVAALLPSALVHHVDQAWFFAIRGGLVIGFATGVGVVINPFIEYYADILPAPRLA